MVSVESQLTGRGDIHLHVSPLHNLNPDRRLLFRRQRDLISSLLHVGPGLFDRLSCSFTPQPKVAGEGAGKGGERRREPSTATREELCRRSSHGTRRTLLSPS